MFLQNLSRPKQVQLMLQEKRYLFLKFYVEFLYKAIMYHYQKQPNCMTSLSGRSH